jgi:hypothetical protein
MKSSVPPAVAIAAIVIAIVLVGFFAFRTLAPKRSASEDITKNADVSQLLNMTDQDKENMKKELEKAKLHRDAVTR